jgi:tryptophanyl-tRNA synthetase
MARILTGIQASGRAHLGNLLGAIEPAIALADASGEAAYLFIADLHALTSQRTTATRIANTHAVALAWLACGLDADRHVFYRQSRIPEVCELMWYLNCFAPYPMLANAHSFKDKAENLKEVNAGLFTYPVLMAADILLYDGQQVPVGKDQKQHLEITRDLASAFNREYGELLVLPEARIEERVMTIPGIDGRKMSKSYNNYIDVFVPDKDLRKRVNSIVTDSTPVEAPKNPDTCHVFALYRLVAPPEAVADLHAAYLAGGLGYGKAKERLYEALLTRYAEPRARFFELERHPELVHRALEHGEAKARATARQVLDRLREAIGVRG